MRKDSYSAGLMSESFWFVEFKKLVTLKYEKASPEEIKRKCIEENYFGMPTQNRIKRTYGYLINRVNSMEDALIELFMDSDLYTQKIINLITILRGDKLFFEFMYEVYRDKNILGYREIELTDINIFFKKKIEQHEELEKWAETTFKHLRSNYRNFLADANLLDKENSHYYITPPILDGELERYLKNKGEITMLKAITGVE